MSRYFDYNSNSIVHFGILGMKWGVRRYQNSDGTLTSAGKDRYGKGGAVSKVKSAIKKYKNKKKMAKLRKAKVEKAKRLAAEAAERERKEKEVAELKKKITSSARELDKNKELARAILSNDEYNRIRERLNNEHLVYDMSRRERDRARQSIERAMDYVATAKRVYDSYETINKILGNTSNNSNGGNKKKKKG